MKDKATAHSEITYTGIPVSEGVISGVIFKLDSGPKPIVKYDIDRSKTAEEISRFENAIIQTRREILDIQSKISKAMGSVHASILNAHLLLIEDFTIIEEVIKRIQKESKNAEHIFSDVMERFTKVFSQMEDEYLRERVSDIKDVTRRVLRNLSGEKHQEFPSTMENIIVLAYDLSPSETTLMHKENVVGLATDIGGKTSHTAIMARSLGIPAVVGLHDVSSKIPNGAPVILDGTRGILIVNPSQETIRKYEDKKSILENYEHQLQALKELPAATQDGHEITLHGNIELPQDTGSVLSHGAMGIGLYRTEYCYMNREGLPSEDDLFNMYREVIQKMEGKPVIIRTLDIGGDKFLCHMKLPDEINPFLGWRAIRFCLERVDIFKTQLSAILRASAFGPTAVMYPMISNVTEVIQANHILKKCMKELKAEGKAYDEKIKVGIMVEIPSAAIAADLIAPHVDFFSIGTNDLIQYTLAVDRINEKIAYLYQPLHPSILRLLQIVIGVGHNSKVDVSCCGEMASDPSAVLLLIGMGIKKLSLSPIAIPKIKSIIRSVKFSECRDLLDKALKCSTADEIKSLLDSVVKRILPVFFTY